MASDEAWDVLILGTGLTEAVLSAALSAAGQRVLHVDPAAYYGSEWASLTLTELVQWAAAHDAALAFPRHEGTAPGTVPDELAAKDRHYALAVRPTLLPAHGPMLEALIRSKVASHATFRLLGCLGVDDGTTVERVPSSKSHIFRDQRISLADKRRLMRFLQWVAAGPAAEGDAPRAPAEDRSVGQLLQDMGLDERLSRVVAHGVALCWDTCEPSSTAVERTRRAMQGMGRYGDAAYLVGQYGGAGELAQGFCRASAVHGGVFVLGHAITSLERTNDAWTLRLDGVDQTFSATQLVAPRAFLPAARPDVQPAPPAYLEHVAVLVHDAPLSLESLRTDGDEQPAPETALLVFAPPTTAPGAPAVMVLAQGEGTFSCPKGQYVYHLVTYGDVGTTPQQCLAPAVERLYALLETQAPWILTLYTSHAVPQEENFSTQGFVDTAAPGTYLPTEPRSSLCWQEHATPGQAVPNLTEWLDASVEAAERAFWRVMGEHHRGAALAAAAVRSKMHAPEEYQGRGGAEPTQAAPVAAEIEFLAPLPGAD